MSEEVKLPYFDAVLKDKDREKKVLDASLNMHWGYWEDPKKAYSSEDQRFIYAAENLSKLIFGLVDINPGCRLADVGCGFGGTIDLINKNYSDLDMVGLNIDPRQIEAAKSRVTAVNNNKIEFITGDACDLPFEDESIDTLLAVECIFHFPDRDKFLSEVGRVLKPGGKLAFSDFVPTKETRAKEKWYIQPFMKVVGMHYGSASPSLTVAQYDEVAKRYGLVNICTKDINKNVMPTYKAINFVIKYSNKGISIHKRIPTKLLELSQKWGFTHYMVIAYQKS